MSINSREDANKYYQQINNLVDDYIDKWKVKPSNLKRYLRPGSDRFNRFLKKNNLDSLKGANIVLNDILDDRASMEKDGVFSFESFKYFESNEFKIDSIKQCLYKGIEKSTISQEKILADYFDVNLGGIEIKDSYKHLYKVEDWQNEDWYVVIYSEEELQLISDNIVEHLYEEVADKSIDIVEEIKIKLSTIVSKSVFVEKLSEKLNREELKKIVSRALGEEWSFVSKVQNHYIWVS